MDENRVQMGERIRAARKARGWNAARLAQEAGVAPNTLSNIERGLGYQDGKLAAVMEALGMDPLAPPAGPDYPADVELARAWLGAYLVALPAKDRQAAMDAMVRFLIERAAGS
jgi:transcriptional regulator with XRE-family HTH domain